ncbi:rhodanese [Gilliamella sp. Fer2-1]|jgi:rhodanese-related sulfurtransferase|uniref:rhodanese-like domain-containing protein n=1 Tax=unclassified Gilliamella TaxID=2685620 RepID=UPI00080E043B|nr:rhodanese-like domain-containing protein [Gilliamella apicola]OCG25881.1 rhodanese [Gilliamella apicola]OCG30426.1 rhodanese [Gilliamella apicola]OCG33161.1 rhodanese [Gilliamella apicola]
MSIEQMVHYQSKLSYELDSADLFSAISKKENIVIIDARSPLSYKKEHIPNAINLWHKDISFNTTDNLEKSKIYICYCDGIGCNASTKACLKLLTLGFNVKELMGGLDWWKRDGFATEGDEPQSGTEINCGC